MKFELKKASDWCWKKEVEINTLEELLNLKDKYEFPLIIDKEVIMIYDDYIE